MPDLTTTPARRFIGCDVGKHFVIVFDSATGRTASLANESKALEAFAAALDPASLVICEATGGYEGALLDALAQAGRAVHRADARKVKAFIRSLGTLAKTDAIDARALARYGQERHDRLPLWRPREEARERLHGLVMTRRDLIEQRVAFRNRLQAPGSGPVAARLERVLRALDEEIAGLEADIAQLIGSHAPLAHSMKVLQTIGGVGATTAATLLALMPELGALPRRQAAALAGLAPHPRQSGKMDAYRRTRGGRPDVKRALFMAALSARKHNKQLNAFYERLVGDGKKPLVALTALMRKIIVIANARLRDAHQPI
jgi:transposase